MEIQEIQEIQSIFASAIFDESINFFSATDRPRFVAHYTSIGSLENILKSQEIWFSNPLLMNDFEELRFGLNTALELIFESKSVRDATRSADEHRKLLELFEFYFKEYDDNKAFDTYVFCTSEHGENDGDGILSMWRGYGGKGKGAAMIFDTSMIKASQDAPLIFAKVQYATVEDRKIRLTKIIDAWAARLKESTDRISDKLFHYPAYMLFEATKIFALTWKHIGFSEEREWRIIYLRERDTSGLLKNQIGYVVTKFGIEPKLKFRLEPNLALNQPTLSFETIVPKILLGPRLSTPFSTKAASRMIEVIGLQGMADRVSGSTIPYRHRRI